MNSHHRISNDRAVHPLRVSYSDQRNHQPRIFNSGCPRCDRYCPYYGTLRMCAKHGFDDRERGAISIGLNLMDRDRGWVRWAGAARQTPRGGRRPYCPLSGLATLTATATLTAGRSYGPAGSRSLADTSRMNTM